MTERTRWALLVLSTVLAFGGGLVVTLAIVDANERERERDFCALLDVFITPGAPPPTTERGQRQLDAIRAYRAKRC
jgi:hypothetical protein